MGKSKKTSKMRKKPTVAAFQQFVSNPSGSDDLSFILLADLLV